MYTGSRPARQSCRSTGPCETPAPFTRTMSYSARAITTRRCPTDRGLAGWRCEDTRTQCHGHDSRDNPKPFSMFHSDRLTFYLAPRADSLLHTGSVKATTKRSITFVEVKASLESLAKDPKLFVLQFSPLTRASTARTLHRRLIF